MCQGDDTTVTFHSKTPSSQCIHPVNVCAGCIATHIETQVNDKGETLTVSCPDCLFALTFEDIARCASKCVFERYDTLLLRRALQALEDFRWCKNAECGSGQIHEGGHDAPIMRCGGCKQLSCFTHDLPWHHGKTCQEMDVTLARNANDAASKAYIESKTKPCPKCRESIEKEGGCDHMTCRPPGGCGYEFCWRCLADYRDIVLEGNHLHRETCQYYATIDETIAPPPPPRARARRVNAADDGVDVTVRNLRRRGVLSAIFG